MLHRMFSSVSLVNTNTNKIFPNVTFSPSLNMSIKYQYFTPSFGAHQEKQNVLNVMNWFYKNILYENNYSEANCGISLTYYHGNVSTCFSNYALSEDKSEDGWSLISQFLNSGDHYSFKFKEEFIQKVKTNVQNKDLIIE